MYISPMRQKKYGYDVWGRFYFGSLIKKKLFLGILFEKKTFAVDFHRLL